MVDEGEEPWFPPDDNAKKWAIDNLDYLNKPMTLFGSSLKVEKGKDKFDTYIIYLQPADKVAINTAAIKNIPNAINCGKIFHLGINETIELRIGIVVDKFPDWLLTMSTRESEPEYKITGTRDNPIAAS